MNLAVTERIGGDADAVADGIGGNAVEMWRRAAGSRDSGGEGCGGGRRREGCTPAVLCCGAARGGGRRFEESCAGGLTELQRHVLLPGGRDALASAGRCLNARRLRSSSSNSNRLGRLALVALEHQSRARNPRAEERIVASVKTQLTIPGLFLDRF